MNEAQRQVVNDRIELLQHQAEKIDAQIAELQEGSISAEMNKAGNTMLKGFIGGMERAGMRYTDNATRGEN